MAQSLKSINLIVDGWMRLIQTSYANNSRLYSYMQAKATGEDIVRFLQWDAKQPPFYLFLERWLEKAPEKIRPHLVSHITQEKEEEHSELFRQMIGLIGVRFPIESQELNDSWLRELNYTFSQECADQEPFAFFCGSFFATEVLSAKRCAELLAGLVRNGVPESELKYLSLHAIEDAEAHVPEVIKHFLLPIMGQPGVYSEIERGIRDRLRRSETYLKRYEGSILS